MEEYGFLYAGDSRRPDFTCLPLYGPRNIEDLKDAMETFSIPFLKEYYAEWLSF